MAKTTAKDIMQGDLITLDPDTNVVDAVRTMLDQGISGAPVVDGDGRLLGVVSERDCIQVLAAAAYHALPGGTVGDHMTRDVTATGADDDVFHLTYLFHENPIRRVVVVDDEERVIGLITRHDLLLGLDKMVRQRESGHHKSTYDILEEHRR